LLYECFSIILVGILFALIYRFLPDAAVGWREALIGGLVTSVLFGVGKTLIGLYLGRNAGASVFGAAGTLAVVLLWIYYAAQLVLFGAEFTQVLAQDNPAQQKIASPSEQAPPEQALKEPESQETVPSFKSKLEVNPKMKLWASVAALAMVVLAWRNDGKIKRPKVSGGDQQQGSA
jgi:Virulence factor BrkB